ncbi:MAG: TonB-dependent receptor [Gemmatimonadota bacterium]|nr:TonB-dependent receptor [Gemmatimonadota bacterium]
MRFPISLPAWIMACLLSALASATAGQEAPASGSVTGVVVAAESQRPLVGAEVVIHPAGLGVLPPGSGPRPLLLGQALTTATDSSGSYRFSHLPAGRYRMYVYALGYRPGMLEIRLSGRESSHLSVGLRVETVALEPVVVTAETAGAPAAIMDAEAGDELSTAVERIRQRRYLSSDVRAVTRADVQQAVTLGESDLFRALQRLPGVNSRDDYTTELWTRGAPWDQTAIYFDGVPLFNPLHAAGAFSAVNADAVGAAFFHPGVQPTALGSGAAGLIDIRTRRGGTDAGRGSAELSLFSGRVAADGRLPGERGGWMFAGRRSHLDLVTGGSVPYSFSDVVARLDLGLGARGRVEASALHESDRLDGEVRELVRQASARWGSSTAQVTVSLALLGGELRHTLGGSRFFARGAGASAPFDGTFPRDESPVAGPYRAPALDNEVTYASFAGLWEGPRRGRAPQLSGGYRLVSQDARFRTAGLWPYRTEPGRPVEEGETLRYGIVWVDAAAELSPRLQLEAGARAELGGEIQGSGPVRLAPRFSGRYRVSPGLSVSAAAGRSFQYAQALVPAGPGYDAVALSSLFWRVAGRGVPALRADLYTLGMEQWLGNRGLASVTAYRREAEGVGISDPTPGWLKDRPLSVPARNDAYGLDASFRRLAGRWTGSASYGYAVSELEAAGLRFPAPTSRKHALDLNGMVRLGRGVQLGGAYTVASGVRFTRYEGILQNCGEMEEGCEFVTYARDPGREQAPTYRSLDLLAEWSGRLGTSWKVGAFAQLRNVLRRNNLGAYGSSTPFCAKKPGESCHPILEAHQNSFLPQMNDFLPGLPFVPFLGVRVTF